MRLVVLVLKTYSMHTQLDIIGGGGRVVLWQG